MTILAQHIPRKSLNTRILRQGTRGGRGGHLLNLHQRRRTRRPRSDRSLLWSTPVVDITHLMHAGDRAVRRAAVLRQELALHIRRLIPRQRNPGIPALLAAIVHQPELADVQIPSTCPAAPVICLPIGNRLLEVIEPRVAPPCKLSYLVPDPALRLAP